MFYTDNLSKLSLSVVREYCHRYPELRQHILADQVVVRSLTRDGERRAPQFTPVPTAHPSPIMLNPVGWTRALADICQQRYHVKFAFQQNVEEPNVYLNYDEERTRSLSISTADPKNPSQRLYREENFDVVVLAAGAATGEITQKTSRLPIIGFSGWAAAIRSASGSLKDSVASLFPPREQKETSLLSLSAPCSLFAYDLPAETEAGKEYRISGLLSLDKTVPTGKKAAATKNTDRLETYLQVISGLDIPLLDAMETPTNSSEIETTQYVRGFTPDGVPLVDHSGGAFNTFVCSGFGDHDADFAPGAAKILSKLVEHRAQKLLEEDYAFLARNGVLAEGTTHKVKLPTLRINKVRRELKDLLRGELPPETETVSSPRWWSCWFGGAKETNVVEEKTAEVSNPYASDRFGNLVSKRIAEAPHHSPLAYLYGIEEQIIAASEPYTRAVRQGVLNHLDQYNLSPDVRRWLYLYFYDSSWDTPEEVARRVEEEEALRKFSMEMEERLAKSTAADAERATQRQLEMERRARTLFRKESISASPE
ncbi:hypothetical protein AGDE_12299 [Angomonas deanei]|uniref:FAD-dependent oxidoreductase domain-containing protein 1 n=1 Tax=Angomonas deanei TaxID=59799 RepID=A0A7G2C372_9TRYP|nr:hypothetical protein AGDE_12299 [Angomonas deanei]CAD2213167.1 FAD dependent oxidoreductase, putative [Angomonas deanei]|eukprot:EPY24533.1 hypothetical protein AGDE_12299 [Angomonas deanei]